MKKTQVFNATNARKNFFRILQLVGEGNVVVIDKKNIGKKFKIIEDISEKKKSKSKIAKQMSKISIPTTSWNKMKKVITEKNKINL